MPKTTRKKTTKAVNDVVNITGARTHNLRGVDVEIPKGQLTVITGISGSGKSSLAFDTLYAEGYRRYAESLSSYARQFLGVMDKPDVDKIEGLSPAIAIDQKNVSHNPRSTVGTITEIYDYLRLLYSRIGVPHCPKCGTDVTRQTPSQITDQLLALPAEWVIIAAPVVSGKKGEHRKVIAEIERQGFLRARIDGKLYRLDELPDDLLADRYKIHHIDVVVDRVALGSDSSADDRSRVLDSVETALRIGKGFMSVLINAHQKKAGRGEDAYDEINFSENFSCPQCGTSIAQNIEPRLFSFNSPYGACSTCTGLGKILEIDPDLVMPNKNLTLAEGAIKSWMNASHRVGRQSYFWTQLEEFSQSAGFSLDVPVNKLPEDVLHTILYGSPEHHFEGVIPNLQRRYHETDSDYTRQEIERYMRESICPMCSGTRLKKEALAVTVDGKNISQFSTASIAQALAATEHLMREGKLSASERTIALPILKEIAERLKFLVNVGLDYLSLDRSATSLAGGEMQRIRLATQIGSGLSGVIYILDEPSIGLHQRDQSKLITALKHLRDLRNTVVVVEHDEQTIRESDWVVDVGPGAGVNGGTITFSGTPQALLKSATLTGEYLSGKKKISSLDFAFSQTDLHAGKKLSIKNAYGHNLKNVDADIPLGKFVTVCGVSGSGKSSLILDTLSPALLKQFYQAKENPLPYDAINGTEYVDRVIVVDQSPIGRTPRSNPATYTGVFTYIRDLFSSLPESKARGYTAGRFSFNVKGGRCEVCQGDGVKKIEMFFLPDVYVECEECRGERYNKDVLSIEYKGKNIAQVLKMSVVEAKEFFANIPPLYEKLKVLDEVGLGYIQLGQSATTLSGGEAQRIKLSTELSRRATGKTVYILDEPTTGLHFDDIKKLLMLLHQLVEKGNSIIVIEHNLDVIATSQWLIEMGPEGGEKGGQLLFSGTPEELARRKSSPTGAFLKQII